MNDVQLAAHIAEQAGRILIDLRASGRFEGKALGVEGDRIANAFIMETLRRERPDDAILSEEEVNDTARCSVDRVWIVDPLDGTREYGEGRTDWAVHVALAIGGLPSLGAVALPGLDGGMVLRSDQLRPLPPAPEKLRMVVSRTRPAAEAVALAAGFGADLVPMGSAGAKAMAIILGQADIYLHSGGQYEWDNCAPVAVAVAHGLHCSRIDGSPLRYNNEDVYLPDLLICRKEHAAKILAGVRVASNDLAEPA
ncbi:3'(2'),5'-bisphosphate nucleotidase CysQ [Rhizorhabdus wittichii]|uniref:3'(2'),5'-bisphosphate nucleotidase CysQ n=1 Tax=Rhizorhabdus wittichii TaxID=160791 RepID=A0A975D3T7_9SPHN|nr:3'(2'),5'-bisphosphate nucleotidase CysQ [Rhizorhabdus wittichii]QTH21160.1 3'(2'),5'-bisphosphate nucleotidase CysQ [Rhizorhabdus wittichii]